MKIMKMKKAMIMTLILTSCLSGCRRQAGEDKKPDAYVKEEQEKQEQEQELVYLTEHAQMEEKKHYNVIYHGELKLEVNNDYIIDKVALTLNNDEHIQYHGKTYIDGEFRYGNYVVKLDTITGSYYYMGIGAKDSFQLGFNENKLMYWLRSTTTATLIINKIYLEI